MILLKKPYLIYLGSATAPTDAKTGFGLKDWCAQSVLGEWSHADATVRLGLARLSPAEAAARGAGSIVIGVAPVGGVLPDAWLTDLEAAIESGLDVVSGLHTRLTSFPTLVAAANKRGVRLIDVRHVAPHSACATGAKRSGKRLLTVGTDCALGKKYTALALTQALKESGLQASFRATGQTGVMIAGEGIPMDTQVADFLAGAAESLTPANDPMHWDVIEGQGSLLHPAYAAVTLGLLHGSQPDALVLCHDPSRLCIEDYPDYPIPPLNEVIELYLSTGKLTNRAIRCVGVSINSSSLTDAAWTEYQMKLQSELGMPVFDPMRSHLDAAVAAIRAL